MFACVSEYVYCVVKTDKERQREKECVGLSVCVCKRERERESDMSGIKRYFSLLRSTNRFSLHISESERVLVFVCVSERERENGWVKHDTCLC